MDRRSPGDPPGDYYDPSWAHDVAEGIPLRKKKNYYQGLLTTNPFDVDHYLYKDFVSHPIPGYKQFFFPQSENEHNLPDGYYQEQRILHADDPEWIKVYLDGDYGAVFDGKPVYPDFAHRIHVAEKQIQPIKKLHLLLGFDFGMVTSACAITQITPHNWLILDEILQDETQGDFDAFMDYIIGYLGVHYQGFSADSFCGPEGRIKNMSDGRSCIEIMQSKGFHPSEGAITQVDRQGAVAKKLRSMSGGKSVVQIDPRCRMIIKGFSGGYERKEIAPGLFGDDVVKNIYSHVQDGLQAIATCVFRKVEGQRRRKKRADPDIRKGVSSVSGL